MPDPILVLPLILGLAFRTIVHGPIAIVLMILISLGAGFLWGFVHFPYTLLFVVGMGIRSLLEGYPICTLQMIAATIIGALIGAGIAF